MPFWLDYRFLYQKRKYELYLYYVSSKNWELEDLLGPAPALCWWRATGVMWDIWYFPPFRPTPRGLELFKACQDSFLLSSTTVYMTGVSRMQKDWYNLEASKKKKNNKILFSRKKFTMSPGPHPLISNTCVSNAIKWELN